MAACPAELQCTTLAFKLQETFGPSCGSWTRRDGRYRLRVATTMQCFENNQGIARARQHLLSQKIRYDIIDAVLKSQQEDLIKMAETALVLEKHIQEATFKPTIEALTRVMNLAKKGQELLSESQLEVKPELFETESEKALFEAILVAKEAFSGENMELNYLALETLGPKVDAFFEDNMVMTDDEKIRNNRLALLVQLGNLALSFASIDQLIVK